MTFIVNISVSIDIDVIEPNYPGDSLPYPKMTKEDLDAELDEIATAKTAKTAKIAKTVNTNFKNYYV